MIFCVLDSSTALSWILPDEAQGSTPDILEKVEQSGATAPALWWIETAHVLLKAERRGRITKDDLSKGMRFLRDLRIEIEPLDETRVWSAAIDIAQHSGLSAYDACYVEAAIRLQLPLATLDKRLGAAASAFGVSCLT